MDHEKCVLVIGEDLPRGLSANAAAILGITLGRLRPDLAGADVTDESGHTHRGIVERPVPILCGSPECIRDLREKLCRPEFQELTTADFTTLAQSCRTYGEFIEKMARTPGEALEYLGLAICGPQKTVTRLTGSLPLLR